MDNQDEILKKQLFGKLYDNRKVDSFDTIASYIDGAIRIIYNSTPDVFVEIFGAESGVYLFHKYTSHFGKNEAEFICYLDHDNQRKLAVAVFEYVQTQDPMRAKAGT